MLRLRAHLILEDIIKHLKVIMKCNQNERFTHAVYLLVLKLKGKHCRKPQWGCRSLWACFSYTFFQTLPKFKRDVLKIVLVKIFKLLASKFCLLAKYLHTWGISASVNNHF